MRARAFRTKSQLAYEYLREAIVTGELEPGERILVNRISEQLGISDTPVREAIRQLSSEGFVTNKVHVGAVVREVSIDLVKELFQIRAVLEALAAVLNLPYLKRDTLAKLETVLEKSKECIAKGDARKYADLNKQFHMLLYSDGPFRHLHKMIEDIWVTHERFRAIFKFVPYRMEQSHKEHLALLEVVKKADAHKLETLMREHKLSAMKSLLEYCGANGLS